MSILKEKKELFESFIESVTGDEPNPTGKQSALDKDSTEMMLSDLETKLLEILQEAKKIMRHSKRHVLTTADVEASFKKLTIKVSTSQFKLINCFRSGNLWLPIFSAFRLPKSDP